MSRRAAERLFASNFREGEKQKSIVGGKKIRDYFYLSHEIEEKQGLMERVKLSGQARKKEEILVATRETGTLRG